MIGKPGPFQIIENDLSDAPTQAPRRRYGCSHYCTCLSIAAALNWDSFTCRGCSCEVNDAYRWRARQIVKKDKILQTLCSEIPPLTFISQEESTVEPIPHNEELIPIRARAKA